MPETETLLELLSAGSLVPREVVLSLTYTETSGKRTLSIIAVHARETVRLQ